MRFIVLAVIPRESLCCRTMPKSPSFSAGPAQTNTFTGVRSRVQRLAAMQLAQHVEYAGDFAPDRRLGPALGRAPEVHAEIAVLYGVFEDQVVVDAAVGADQRERVEEANGAIVSVEHLAKVHLRGASRPCACSPYADGLRHGFRGADACRMHLLAEAACANLPLDAVLKVGLGALNDFAGGEQLAGLGRLTP